MTRATGDLTRLLTGEADAQEVERLLELTETDVEASGELDLLADLAAAVERERDHLEESLPTHAGELRPVRPVPPLTRFHPRLALAAAVVAGLLALLWQQTGPDAPARLGAPAYVRSDLRAGGAPLATAFARAMRAYEEGDLVRAAADLDAFLAEQREHALARFYRAACHEDAGEDAAARELYRAVADASGVAPLLGEHARWRLAHVELAAGEADLARATLAQLASGAGPFAAPASELLDELGP